MKKVNLIVYGLDAYGKEVSENITITKYNFWDRFRRWLFGKRIKRVDKITTWKPRR
jgi:hypothetical protein